MPVGVALAVVAFVFAFGADGLGVCKGALEGTLGRDFVTFGECEAAEVVFVQEFGLVGGRVIDSGFDDVAGALSAPEEPMPHGELFDEEVVLLRGGLVFGLEAFQEYFEIDSIFAGEDRLLRGSAVNEGVVVARFW